MGKFGDGKLKDNELYLDEKNAQTVIDIAKSFNVNAQVIGYVEANEKPELRIVHGNENLEYSKSSL